METRIHGIADTVEQFFLMGGREMKLKRILSAVLGLSVAAGLTAGLSGCGGDKSNTLVWYMIGDKPAAHDKVMAKANEIIEPAIGMKLDIKYIDSASFTEKMKMKMASGEAYDLTFTGYVNPYQTAIALGGLYDITELIKETGLDQVIPGYYIEAAEVNGKVYGIPNIQVISNPIDIEIPTSVAEECGITDLLAKLEEKSNINSTYDDLLEAAAIYDEMFAKVHEKRPDLYTFNPNNSPFYVAVYDTLMGGAALKKNGSSQEFVNLYKTDEWKLSVQKKREWYTKDYIRNDIASAGDTLTNAEERMKVAFTFDTWKPGQEAYQKIQYGEEFLHAKVFQPYVGRTSALATMVSVGANTKHPKEAVELMKLVNTDKDLFNIICWGIEGETYTKNADGTVTPVEGGGYEGVGQNAWKFGNQFNGFVQEGQPADVWEQTEKMNNEADKSPMLGFVPDTSAIDTEIANITNIEAEYKARKDFGTEDMSVWYDEFMTKLNQAGIEKVIAELQKQYDEWLKTK